MWLTDFQNALNIRVRVCGKNSEVYLMCWSGVSCIHEINYTVVKDCWQMITSAHWTKDRVTFALLSLKFTHISFNKMPCSVPQSAGISIHRVGIHRSFLKVLNSSKNYIHVLYYLPKENTHTLREICFDFKYVSFYTIHIIQVSCL